MNVFNERLLEEEGIAQKYLAQFPSVKSQSVEDLLQVLHPQEELPIVDHQFVGNDFTDTRIPIKELLQELYRDILSELFPNPENGAIIEVGPGPKAYVFNNLLPEEYKQNWVMVEVSQPYIDAAKKVTAENSIFLQGHWSGIPYKGKIIGIGGNSSADSPVFLDSMLMHLWEKLEPGGKVWFVQDVFPGLEPLLWREAIRRTVKDIDKEITYGYSESGLGWIEDETGKKLTSFEHLQRDLLETGIALGYKKLESGMRILSKDYTNNEYIQQFGEIPEGCNSVLRIGVVNLYGHSDKVPEEAIRLDYGVFVTLMEKPEDANITHINLTNNGTNTTGVTSTHIKKIIAHLQKDSQIQTEREPVALWKVDNNKILPAYGIAAQPGNKLYLGEKSQVQTYINQ